ncbi:hypothetical protein H2203_001451 [Taxawa tesnikishii (nom. ined.)]|nr:hypothetical protein H2203_001451 [Dothideales sp. JES 119]
MPRSQVQDAFLQRVFKGHEDWRQDTLQKDPEFFDKSAKGQSPKILWIGCADSRIPESTVLGLKPGDVFVHRNIGNILTETDLSATSVIEYAIRHLKVDHVIVCGHTSCGGVNAALANQKLAVLDLWLQPLRLLRLKHTDELEKLSLEDRSTRLSQLNVLHSLEVLKMNATVIEAMKERGLELHGIIYNLQKGRLEPMEHPESEDDYKKRLAAFEMH